MSESKYDALCKDIRDKGFRDVCYICKHFDSNPECDAECEQCKKTCACKECRDCNLWDWRGA